MPVPLSAEYPYLYWLSFLFTNAAYRAGRAGQTGLGVPAGEMVYLAAQQLSAGRGRGLAATVTAPPLKLNLQAERLLTAIAAERWCDG